MKWKIWLFLLSLSSIFAQHGYLESHVWLNGHFLLIPQWPEDLPPMPDYESPLPAEDYEKVIELLLAESLYLYSGSIYGWEFIYRPADESHGVEEYYEIQLMGSLPWGSSNVIILKTYREESIFHMESRLNLTETQRLRRENLLSNQWADGGGMGSGSPYGEFPRKEALDEAIKEAIRNYLRPRMRRRPREITGRIYLREMPNFSQGPDFYRCQVMVKLNLDDPVEYPMGY